MFRHTCSNCKKVGINQKQFFSASTDKCRCPSAQTGQWLAFARIRDECVSSLDVYANLSIEDADPMALSATWIPGQKLVQYFTKSVVIERFHTKCKCEYKSLLAYDIGGCLDVHPRHWLVTLSKHASAVEYSTFQPNPISAKTSRSWHG
jgi:hypothetical protein